MDVPVEQRHDSNFGLGKVLMEIEKLGSLFVSPFATGKVCLGHNPFAVRRAVYT